MYSCTGKIKSLVSTFTTERGTKICEWLIETEENGKTSIMIVKVFGGKNDLFTIDEERTINFYINVHEARGKWYTDIIVDNVIIPDIQKDKFSTVIGPETDTVIPEGQYATGPIVVNPSPLLPINNNNADDLPF
jgi:hypothetical protein